MKPDAGVDEMMVNGADGQRHRDGSHRPGKNAKSVIRAPYIMPMQETILWQTALPVIRITAGERRI